MSLDLMQTSSRCNIVASHLLWTTVFIKTDIIFCRRKQKFTIWATYTATLTVSNV